MPEAPGGLYQSIFTSARAVSDAMTKKPIVSTVVVLQSAGILETSGSCKLKAGYGAEEQCLVQRPEWAVSPGARCPPNSDGPVHLASVEPLILAAHRRNGEMFFVSAAGMLLHGLALREVSDQAQNGLG